jgi:hypothetical protein
MTREELIQSAKGKQPEAIFEQCFKNGMLNKDFNAFKRTHTTLLKVVLDAIELAIEAERYLNAENNAKVEVYESAQFKNAETKEFVRQFVRECAIHEFLKFGVEIEGKIIAAFEEHQTAFDWKERYIATANVVELKKFNAYKRYEK